MKEICSSLLDLLKEKHLTLATAESCTGGLIAKSITDISGASEVFYGGVVSYDNSVKMGILGVSDETLRAYGAVSHQTAKEMALGVCKACNVNVALSTTGIAGPTGGTKEKPVGTVFVGICINGSVQSQMLSISPALSRDEIRHEALRQALLLLIQKISEIS